MNQKPSKPSDLLVADKYADELKEASIGFPSLTLNRRQSCDLELLINGGFHPLDGFMGRQVYESVVDNARLPDGSLWPIPITLDISPAFADTLEPGEKIALRDPEGFMPAVLTVSDIWTPDKKKEAASVFGSLRDDHPGVQYLLQEKQAVYLGGMVEGIQYPTHYEFESLWNTPEELRHLFKKMGWRRVLAFHSSNPMHRLQREFILSAAKKHNAHILLHPAVGVTKPGDLHYFARVHCYQAIRRCFPHELATLSLLPLAMRMAGPKEALWHAMVNKNYGCSHFIVGPDHASPPPIADKAVIEPHYGKYEAQRYVEKYADEVGIDLIPIAEHHWVAEKKRFCSDVEIDSEHLDSQCISHADLKDRLVRGQDIPDWYSYPEVIDRLKKVYPPRHKRGMTLFFTGLSGSGKSTLASIVFAKLIESGSRPVSLLDGDIVRQNLSSELGFSRQHRDINIRRIGFVASEISKNGGVAICAPIAPYMQTRRAVRELIEEHGAFIEIHVSTPLDVCEARDRKGLYMKARKGLIPEFTGISDPYEIPEYPEVRIDTSEFTPAEAAQEILLFLLKEGYLDE